MQGYGDYETPEQGIPLYGPEGEWEFCTTINDSWGYRPSDNDYKTSGQIIRMFCEEDAVIAHGLQIVTYLAFCYPLFSLTEVFSSAMRGAGNAVKPTVITLLGVCVLRMAMLFLITFPHPSNLTIAICYPVTWTVSSLMFLIYYKFGNWLPAWKEKA